MPENIAKKATKEERHKALWYNPDVVGPKLGGNSKYNAAERKTARKHLRREGLKGQAKGWGAGATAGAAAGLGVAAASKGKYRKGVSAGFGVLGGGLAGQQVGGYHGVIRGQRKYKAEIGKSTGISAFGVNHGA